MRRIFGNGSYANVTATLALVIALGGTSYAAIKLPKNSVTSTTVKDRSLMKKDFRPGQLPAGKRGPAGPAGPAGDGGAGGGGGAFFQRVEAFEPLVVGTADQTIQSLSLPAGNWVVTAKFIAENKTPGGVEGVGKLACTLTLGGAALDTLGSGGIDFDPPGAANTTLTGAGTLGGPGAATVVCNTLNTVGLGGYWARSITAVQASSVAAG
jgi:hypothetical protein